MISWIRPSAGTFKVFVSTPGRSSDVEERPAHYQAFASGRFPTDLGVEAALSMSAGPMDLGALEDDDVGLTAADLHYDQVSGSLNYRNSAGRNIEPAEPVTAEASSSGLTLPDVMTVEWALAMRS